MFENIRKSIITERVRGNILDIGCGENKIEGAFGIDIKGASADFKGDVSSANLISQSFDTVVLSAVLNYLKNPGETISEISRICKDDGLVLVTCVNRIGGFLHRLFRKSEPRGMSAWAVISLFNKHGFSMKLSQSFMCGLNRLYVFKK